ncbi:hypothetical protein EVAR_5325_1 [Eumeta japonica]|uniref:Uncharacterized protein n=1 Tax=Eumeta variegata TaxID=151549 RepID=A0A4C1TM95_EUMVA|nr:hypothetical protein EVAR_5325_1 [Eumeta japonica]
MIYHYDRNQETRRLGQTHQTEKRTRTAFRVRLSAVLPADRRARTQPAGYTAHRLSSGGRGQNRRDSSHANNAGFHFQPQNNTISDAILPAPYCRDL